MDIYTMNKWAEDRSFNAKPGQEITAEVYEEMLNVMPPKSLPEEIKKQERQKFHLKIHAGFLMGETAGSNKNGLLYHAFGMNIRNNKKYYYYLGIVNA